MITRFDHAVIAVRDLDKAIHHYRTLGFDVRSGGQHVGLGTHNAIIRFGLDYIELLSIYDETLAASSGARGEVLLNFLRKREGGLVGYALATTNVQQEAERLRSNLAVGEPFAMQRMRPDGNLLKWHLLVPGAVAWRRPWPFFIQWDTPDEQRLSWEEPGMHTNGATSWIGVAVAVRDLKGVANLYQHQIGLQVGPKDEVPHLVVQRATFHIGSSRIDLLKPVDEGPVRQMIAEVGEGPFEITLAVRDLEHARLHLTQAGANLKPYSPDSSRVILPPHQTLGVNIILKQQEVE